MLSNEGFFTFKIERCITQITDGSEVFALARLTFDENLLIGGERSVRVVPIKLVEFRENVWAFLRDKENCL